MVEEIIMDELEGETRHVGIGKSKSANVWRDCYEGLGNGVIGRMWGAWGDALMK